MATGVYGISLNMAIFGEGLNQISKFTPDFNNPEGWFDETRDTQMIIKGYNLKIK